MDFKRLVVAHGEKLVAVIVAVLCLGSIFGSVKELQTESGLDDELSADLRNVDDALRKNSPTDPGSDGRPLYRYAREVPDFATLVRNFLDARISRVGSRESTDTTARFLPPSRTWYELPLIAERIAKIDSTEYRHARFLPAMGLTVAADRGRVSISWSDNAENKHSYAVRYDVFKRIEDQDEYPSAPWKTVKGRKPEPVTNQPAARPGRVRRRPLRGRGAPQIVQTASYDVEDRDVEPKKRYFYKVRAIGRALEVEGIKVFAPPLNEVRRIKEAGQDLWVAGFSEEASDKTPSDVQLFFTGTAQIDDEELGVFLVRRWNLGAGGWDSLPVRVGIDKAIAGRKAVGIGEVLKIDSGYKLLELGSRTEEIVSERRVPKTDEDWNLMHAEDGSVIMITEQVVRKVEVKIAKVVETKTGQTQIIKMSKPGEAGEDGGAGGIEEEEKEEAPTGRRRVRQGAQE